LPKVLSAPLYKGLLTLGNADPCFYEVEFYAKNFSSRLIIFRIPAEYISAGSFDFMVDFWIFEACFHQK
jgi:hypothetical protein